MEGAAFEVALASSALLPDGSKAAKVAAHGSNRAKLKQGVARLKGVRLSAEEAGTYSLRVSSHSRKVAVQDGSLLVEVGGLMSAAVGGAARADCGFAGTLDARVHALGSVLGRSIFWRLQSVCHVTVPTPASRSVCSGQSFNTQTCGLCSHGVWSTTYLPGCCCTGHRAEHRAEPISGRQQLASTDSW